MAGEIRCRCDGWVDCNLLIDRSIDPYVTIEGDCDCHFHVDHFSLPIFNRLQGNFVNWMERGVDYHKNLNCSIRHPFNFNNVQVHNARTWGLFQKLWFSVRAIYHISMAFFLDYGVWILRAGNFISQSTKQTILANDVGGRLSFLFLEYHGFGYNVENHPNKTIEVRLWNWILRR